VIQHSRLIGLYQIVFHVSPRCLHRECPGNSPGCGPFVSQEFETLCQDFLPNLYPEQLFLDIGRWWYKEYEVDVVGFTTDGSMVVKECKFTSAPFDHSVLASLEDLASEIRWTPDTGGVDMEYALFTRSGATQSVQEAVSERDDLQSFNLGDVTARS